MTTTPRFHLAFPVHDLGEARAFYSGVLGCVEGRSADEWVDFDFFGHQIVAHLSASDAAHKAHNLVDGEEVPVRHFGVILSLADWRELARRLKDRNVRFLIEPATRFDGLPGEQGTFFVADPSGNALEFKAFADEFDDLRQMMRPSTLAMALGGLSLALIVAVLGFQYLGGIPPCEMCHWQRWPHIAAAAVGLGGGLLIRAGIVEEGLGATLAWLTVALIAISGGLGVYHAGVEWHLWRGPQACTGSAFRFTGGALNLNAHMVMCDVAAWRLFGISLAGYNALVSLASAASGAWLLAQMKKRS